MHTDGHTSDRQTHTIHTSLSLILSVDREDANTIALMIFMRPQGPHGATAEEGGGGGESLKSEKIPLGELKISCLTEEGGRSRRDRGGGEGGRSPPKAVKKIINEHLLRNTVPSPTILWRGLGKKDRRGLMKRCYRNRP